MSAAAAALVKPAKPAESDLMNVSQAAAYLHVSESSIRAYIREGQLKAFRVAGLRKVLIARGELLKLLEPVRAEDAGRHGFAGRFGE